MDLREPGNPIDERTPALRLPLVHILNAAEDDVGRMRAAVLLLDALVADRVTQAQLVAAVAALVGSSPAALDTLQELGAALGNDPHFATTIVNALAGKATTGDLAALQAAVAAITFASLQGKPTTLAGYGITDAAPRMVLDSVVKTAAFVAALDTIYLIDSSGGAFAITMPAVGIAGRAVEFIDVGGAMEAKNVSLARNGLKFRGSAEDYILNKPGVRRRALYINAAYGWSI